MGTMAKYEWRASNSAPKGSPMKLVVGGLLLTGGGELYIPSTVLHDGWGNSVSLHVVGDKLKALPERMTVTFYSYFEDKFYLGTFDLPRARIEELFAAGYRTRREKSGMGRFDEIVAGVAPGGSVAVWLVGVGRQQEVFFGQAREVDLDWHDALRIPPSIDRKDKIERAIAESAGIDDLVLRRRQHLDLSTWSRYRQKYAVRPAFEGFDVPVWMELQSFNGEQEDLFFPQDEVSLRERRAPPRYITFHMVSLHKRVELTFDEEETLSSFERLSAGGQPVELVFRRQLENGTAMFGVYLRNASETVEMNQIKMEFYDL
ncbi:MAG: hypothetical protein JWN04_2827, partial [Myxococcaceae bacterium]|nr:hypothetical protein [Myxococcaceae bacterium]